MKGLNELDTFLNAESEAKPETKSLEDILNTISEVLASLAAISTDLSTLLGKEATEPTEPTEPAAVLEEPAENINIKGDETNG